ncbi:hypothetical protein ACFWPQ_39675 [Streptomyces sp. NPDC058464]
MPDVLNVFDVLDLFDASDVFDACPSRFAAASGWGEWCGPGG